MITAESIAPPEPRGPAVIERGHLNAICALPDVLQLAWCANRPDAREVLSDRERAHAATILAADPLTYAAAARYIRQQLTSGDHVTARGRLSLSPGAILTFDGRRYTVIGKRGGLTELRGERGGHADLCEPFAGGVRWCLYLGGVGSRNAKCHTYRRDDRDGTFTAAK